MVSRALREAVLSVAANDAGIRALYLFGSRLSGHARPDSDLDLGVLYRHREPLAATLTLEEQLERATDVDVSLTSKISSPA